MFWHMDVKSSSSNCSGRFEMRTVWKRSLLIRFSQEHSFEVVFYFYAVVVVVVVVLIVIL